MKVYRVETPEGQGPYCSRLSSWPQDVAERLSAMGWAHCDPENHPNVGADKRLSKHTIEGFDIFGFESMTSLFSWFGGWLPGLIRDGFKVSTYEVPDMFVKLGAKQLVFNQTWATKL